MPGGSGWFSEADAAQLGQKNEKRIKTALERLKKEGEIHDFYKTQRSGELDRRGIDFQIYPEADWLINLQVKSSELRRKEHVKDYGKTIPCVVVNDSMDDRQLAEEVKRILGLSIQAIINRN